MRRRSQVVGARVEAVDAARVLLAVAKAKADKVAARGLWPLDDRELTAAVNAPRPATTVTADELDAARRTVTGMAARALLAEYLPSSPVVGP